MKLRYFDISDFDSPDEPGSGIKMKDSTLKMIDNARHIAKMPFVVNSGYRTESHNSSLRGASLTSSHLNGYAVDIRVLNSADRFHILKACIEAGFHRIGVYTTFIHVDNDPTKSPRIWKR